MIMNIVTVYEQDTNLFTNFSLTEAEKKYFDEHLSTLIYLICVSLIGTFGNIHIIIVYWLYYKPSHHRIFILFLAIVDIIPCGLLIPYTIVFSLRYRYTYKVGIQCKIYIILAENLGLSSIAILTVFSVERYKKICCSINRQFSTRQVMFACCVTICFASLLCLPILVFFGNDYPIEDPDIWKTCTVLKSYRNTIIFQLYLATVCGICVILFIIGAVAYVLLGKSLYHKRRASIFQEKTFDTTIHDDLTRRRQSVIDKPTKTILAFFTATLLSYLFFIAAQFVVFALNYFDGAAIFESLGPFYGIILRFNYMSHAVNPIVYGFLDNHFRQKCKRLYKCLFVNDQDRRHSTTLHMFADSV